MKLRIHFDYEVCKMDKETVAEYITDAGFEVPVTDEEIVALLNDEVAILQGIVDDQLDIYHEVTHCEVADD